MLFANALVYRSDYSFHRGDFAVENGRFTDEDNSGEKIDLAGQWAIPGLIDIHVHGNSGADFSDGKDGGLDRIARYLLQCGITSFAPASLTLPNDRLKDAFGAAARLRARQPAGTSRILGVTMEGPFLNPAKKGAQNAAHLLLPDFDLFCRLNQAAAGMIKIVCIAPELAGALTFIKKASRVCAVSIAHTVANYTQAKAGFDAGARHVTHLFNAMPPLSHREPGVIGAAAENRSVTAELITDGIHVHPSAIRAAFAMFGAGRLVLVSDSMAACGMKDGEYELGGLKVFVTGSRATLADGTIAGSATHLFDCFRTALSCRIRPEDAVRAASINPARVIGAEREIGSIETGKIADFVVCNPDWSIASVYQAGEKQDVQTRQLR